MDGGIRREYRPVDLFVQAFAGEKPYRMVFLALQEDGFPLMRCDIQPSGRVGGDREVCQCVPSRFCEHPGAPAPDRFVARCAPRVSPVVPVRECPSESAVSRGAGMLRARLGFVCRAAWRQACRTNKGDSGMQHKPVPARPGVAAICLLLLFLQAPCGLSGQTLEERITSILGRMTMEEKIKQLHQDGDFRTATNSRL